MSPNICRFYRKKRKTKLTLFTTKKYKSRVKCVNQDNKTHRLCHPNRTRNEEDCSPNKIATSPKKFRCLVDSYGCINGSQYNFLRWKRHLQGPEAVERPDVDDFLCLTYFS